MQNKIINIIIFLLLNLSNVEAQYALNTDFNYSPIDNNICIKLEKSIGTNTIGVGLRLHINPPYPTERQYAFFDRNGYSDEFSSFIGLNIGYQRLLSPKKWKHLNISLFNETFYSKMKTRQKFATTVETFKKANFIENYTGLGVKLKIINPISLSLKVGGGLLFVWDIDHQIGIDDHWTWQFAALFSAGINVKL